jgi:hypothetical protein
MNASHDRQVYRRLGASTWLQVGEEDMSEDNFTEISTLHPTEGIKDLQFERSQMRRKS